jgi:hypothetical protein
MRRARHHGAGAALPVDPDRPAVRVRCGRWFGVPEDVVKQRQQGAESLTGCLEHMFVRLRLDADGSGPHHPSASRLAGALGTPSNDGRQAPSEDQTSSLVRMRSTTAEVNSVVPAWPPRSGVFTPDATVSSVPS